MGDTYFIQKIKCAYCDAENNFKESGHIGQPYTFEFGGEFICEQCKKKNKIIMNFVAVKFKQREKIKSKK